MAVGIHVVRIKMAKVGNKTVRRVVAEAGNDNSTGNPTVEEYVIAEAADNYLVNHLDDYMCITLNGANVNAL